jgi:hypothetical protein
MKHLLEAKEIEIVMAKKLSELKPGDNVHRWLAGCNASMSLTVKSITANRIVCFGGWEFCRVTGAEIDEQLGWGPDGVTGSYIQPGDAEDTGFAE